ncbi:3,4-dihydroxy-2-butanone-4-phosphate synthase [bacterium]|nr:3,4-dihydroxy-2-butanone-4-phosphate synthase [bacterium]
MNTIEELIQDIRLGKMVILMDDEDRENEGDLVMAAECVTPEAINFMAREARGLICLPMSRERCERLRLPLMVDSNGGSHGTNFTVSIEAAEGVTTGISAADRAATVLAAVAKGATADSIVQPGHIFPLMAQPGGVLARAGHTEAGCDLAELAGFDPSAVIVEIMKDDGTMARRDDLYEFAEKHGLKIGTIADLIHYRLLHNNTIQALESGSVMTDYGEFTLHAFRDAVDDKIHLAMVKGDIDAGQPVLVRVHVASLVRDLFATQVPDKSGWNMHRCLKRIAEEGAGVVVLLSHDDKPRDWLEDVQIAMGAREMPKMTDAKGRGFLTVGVGSQILRQLGVGKMRLMSQQINYSAIAGFDLEVVEYVNSEN